MFGYRHIRLAVAAVAALLMACSPRGLREAQSVVTQADSLWQAGLMYDDSLRLAEAYRTLDDWQWIYPDEFAHSGYHYGRLLRTRDNPVEAMQCFISATHSRTRDYHILGRVYSNMGSICHLASEFPLSYEIFERSANYFLRNGDTLLYYYGLNNMAFEKAQLSEKDSCFSLLASISPQSAMDEYLVFCCGLTKAHAYLKYQQYDSAIYQAQQLSKALDKDFSAALILAQAYDNLNQRDSALVYANIVLDSSDAPYQNKFNALYVVLHNDSTLCANDINALGSQREDIRYYEYEPEKEELTHAVLLLKQDINHETDLMWLYAILITITLLGGFFYWRYYYKKQLMQQEMDHLVERHADSITQSIKQHIDIYNLNDTLHWKNYASMKADADLYMGGIARKLTAQKLNETEVRFCILTMLDFSPKQIADITCYSYPSAIKTLKKRISTKLGTKPQLLKDFLFKLSTAQ